jgi:hypothetical protein
MPLSPESRRLLALPPRSRSGLKPCGTNAAWNRHKRLGEKVDFACKLAHSRHEAARRKARKAATKELISRHKAEFMRLCREAIAEAQP